MLKFWLWGETIVLYKDILFFWNWTTLPPLGPPERILPPIKWNSSFIARFWWNLKHNIFMCSLLIIEMEIYDKGPPSPSLKNVDFLIHWPILIKFDFFEGGWGGGGPFIINFYINYYWWTYENVMFQISSKSGN